MYFGQGFDGAVQLAGAHAQTVAVDGRVGAAIDHAAALVARVNLQPVTMTPDRAGVWPGIAAAGLAAVAGRIHVEIARQVARAAVVAPQKQRHRRNWLGANQLADFADDRLAGFIPCLNGSAQHAALHFSGRLR